MEEILASIRRIISDDEAKPAATAAAAAPAPKAEAPKPEPTKTAPPARPVMTGIPPSKLSVAKPAPAPAAAKNSQADIDAMMADFDAPVTPPKAEIEPDGDVFDLTEQMAVPESAFSKIEPADDLEFTEAPVPPPVAKPSYQRPPVMEQAPRDLPQPQILSGHTVSAVESAFNALANTVLSNNARTLEDLVKEMLRPMLKSWLDDNLPNLVERIVKAEIERVSRGR